ncbi:DUF998 domain-containing protein [Nocardiopsis sp. NRRL B-16309]|uniref:DUF998 domain-containing protein n=1 Tax=Nocardiopsis sp. NRRL B-16309 TaxID=1519494 RepID=UPI001E410F77|nr:DUF998 domain-containing protein [Nocardiopsis sp. NRRL B-16309]
MTALLWAGAAGAWLFNAVFLLDGLTRPGYHPVRQPVSALALGPRGWVQTADFLVCGLLITAGAVAVPGAFGSVPLTLAIAALGLALTASGVFRMDPMRGYPPGTPDTTPEDQSRAHRLHDMAGGVVFLLLPGTPLVAAFALSDPVWQWGSGIVGVAAAVGTGLFGRAWENDAPRAGLVQRPRRPGAARDDHPRPGLAGVPVRLRRRVVVNGRADARVPAGRRVRRARHRSASTDAKADRPAPGWGRTGRCPAGRGRVRRIGHGPVPPRPMAATRRRRSSGQEPA